MPHNHTGRWTTAGPGNGQARGPGYQPGHAAEDARAAQVLAQVAEIRATAERNARRILRAPFEVAFDRQEQAWAGEDAGLAINLPGPVSDGRQTGPPPGDRCDRCGYLLVSRGHALACPGGTP